MSRLNEILKDKYGGKMDKNVINKCKSIPFNNLYQLMSMTDDIKVFEKIIKNYNSENKDTRWINISKNKKLYDEEYTHIDNMLQPPDVKDGVYKCGKCGNRKTRNISLQLRSGDEPMTTFVHCLNCNNRWKD